MAQPAVRQFAGDIRFWEKQSNGSLIPVIPEPTDPAGNQPLELDTLTFGYEAGEEQNVVSKRRDARYLQPIHAATLPGSTSVSVTALEIPPIILARMLFGEASGATVSAGSVTSVEHAITRIDVPFQLPHRMLTNSPAPAFEKVGTPSNTPLVAGTDYVIDLRRGQVRFLAGGAVSPGDDVEATYSYAAHVKTTITGGSMPTREFYVTGDMQDRISGENGELRIPQVNLTTDGEIDWLSSEPIQVAMTGVCVVASGEVAAYTFETYKASA